MTSIRHHLNLVEDAHNGQHPKGPDTSRLMQNPAFVKWFGKSKCVDANGNPLTMFHGTSADIEAFSFKFAGRGNDQLGSGFYFTTNPEEAGGVYAGRDNETTANVMPVVLSIKKPLDADAEGRVTFGQALKMIQLRPDDDGLSNWGDISNPRDIPRVMREAAQAYAFDEPDNLVRGLYGLANDIYRDDVQAFNTALYKVFGWDGVVKNWPERGGSQHWMAFFPEQIKSVFNKGAFSKKNPNVSESFLSEEGMNYNIGRMRSLLTMAGHPGTPDPEALNALRSFYAMAQKANLDMQNVNFEDQRELVAKLRKEIAALKQQVQQLRARGGTSSGYKSAASVLPTFR